MVMKKGPIIFFYFLIIFVLCIGCNSTKSVIFKSYVDTSTKSIDFQNKKTYQLNDLGVYASNEFDGARLNGFEKENDSTVLVIISPENEPINNSPYYAFKTWSQTPKAFYFKFQYPKGFKHRYIPKTRIENNWNVIDSSRIFTEDTIVTIKLQLYKDPIIVAAQEIQSSKDVENWYLGLIHDKEGYVNLKSAGKSRLGRNLPVLDIYKGDKKGKDIVVLLTRQHPPEVTGYYAFQSFLTTILSESDLSNRFLSKYRVLAFPILNPDGVDLGHWRHNEGGIDLNRDWSLYNQPEIRQVVKFINRNSHDRVVLGLDFHSTWYDVFYTNKQRDHTAFPNFENDWFKALEARIPDYKVNEQSANSNKPTSKGWFLNGHNAVGITYEIGDATSKNNIQIIGAVSANEMMKILLPNN